MLLASGCTSSGASCFGWIQRRCTPGRCESCSCFHHTRSPLPTADTTQKVKRLHQTDIPQPPHLCPNPPRDKRAGSASTSCPPPGPPHHAGSPIGAKHLAPAQLQHHPASTPYLCASVLLWQGLTRTACRAGSALWGQGGPSPQQSSGPSRCQQHRAPCPDLW